MEDVIEAAIALRTAQKRFFKTRANDDLVASKKLELEFDKNAPDVLNRSRAKKA